MTEFSKIIPYPAHKVNSIIISFVKGKESRHEFLSGARGEFSRSPACILGAVWTRSPNLSRPIFKTPVGLGMFLHDLLVKKTRK